MNRLTQPLGPLLDADVGDWRPLVERWRASPAGRALVTTVNARVADGAVVYPAQVLNALQLTRLAATRVLILGQDPYHGEGQAEGLAFSVPVGQRTPPSLRNIFKELQRSLGLATPASGSLRPWAGRGVLLLNTVLTVEEGRPGSHAAMGWQSLTDAVCLALAEDPAPKIFMLWGAHAQGKAPALAAAAGVRHRILECNHPSPLSALRPPRPFIGCGHFAAANRFLSEAGRGAVDWSLP